MAALKNARQEAYCQARAKGSAPVAAYVEAGYAYSGRYRFPRLEEKNDISERIAELVHHLARGGSRDLGPVIDEMLSMARAAIEVKNAAAFVAAKGFLVEAARLKLMLPHDGWANKRPHIDINLSDEEWTKRFGAPAP